jgi:hypothetical protein
MRFAYSTTDPSQSDLDSLPRLPLTLRYGQRQISALGLVDSGAIVEVLPDLRRAPHKPFMYNQAGGKQCYEQSRLSLTSTETCVC